NFTMAYCIRAPSSHALLLVSVLLLVSLCFCFFFFSSRRRHTRSKRDWSSDVCSSDLKLRERNRNYLEFQVSDDNKAIMLLESQFGISDYEVHAEGNIRVYSHLGKQGRLNKAFVENGIEVLKINISEE